MGRREGIVPVGEDRDDDLHMWPGRFSAHWEPPGGDSPVQGPRGSAPTRRSHGAARHADVVLIRLGDSDVHHSAGARPPDSDPSMPVWVSGTRVARRRWPGYEHLDLVADEPIEWEARLPDPADRDGERILVRLRARTHAEAMRLALEEHARLEQSHPRPRAR